MWIHLNNAFRFSPACAGNTRAPPESGRMSAVQPRVCGEHSSRNALMNRDDFDVKDPTGISRVRQGTGANRGKGVPMRSNSGRSIMIGLREPVIPKRVKSCRCHHPRRSNGAVPQVTFSAGLVLRGAGGQGRTASCRVQALERIRFHAAAVRIRRRPARPRRRRPEPRRRARSGPARHRRDVARRVGCPLPEICRVTGHTMPSAQQAQRHALASHPEIAGTR